MALLAALQVLLATGSAFLGGLVEAVQCGLGFHALEFDCSLA